jgi:hypothetical protein
MFEVGDMVRDGSNNDEGVVGVLEDGARKVIDKGVEEKASKGGQAEHLLEDISNNVEKERGERVSLSKTTKTLDIGSSAQECR